MTTLGQQSHEFYSKTVQVATSTNWSNWADFDEKGVVVSDTVIQMSGFPCGFTQVAGLTSQVCAGTGL